MELDKRNIEEYINRFFSGEINFVPLNSTEEVIRKFPHKQQAEYREENFQGCGQEGTAGGCLPQTAAGDQWAEGFCSPEQGQGSYQKHGHVPTKKAG